MFKGNVALVAGEVNGIGKCIADEFQKQGAQVTIDKAPGEHLVGDIADKRNLETFITEENICIDGGMTRLMVYHGDHGWEYKN